MPTFDPDNPPHGQAAQLPPHAFMVRLRDARHREIDLRMVSRVEIIRARKDGSVWAAQVHFFGGANPLPIHSGDAEAIERAHRVQQERRASHAVSGFSGQNLDESDRPLVETDGGFEVYSWTPGRDGQGKAEQVHLVIPVTIADVRLRLVHRFKTRGALDALLDAMVKHREDVWPTT